MSSTEQIDLTDGRAAELKFQDGSVLRLRWDKGADAIKVIAVTVGPTLATRLGILPWTENSIMVKVSE